MVTLSALRESEGYAISIVGIVVVHVAVVIHITEVSVVVAISRTQPPVVGSIQFITQTFFYHF